MFVLMLVLMLMLNGQSVASSGSALGRKGPADTRSLGGYFANIVASISLRIDGRLFALTVAIIKRCLLRAAIAGYR
jgi:hypothetical protein